MIPYFNENILYKANPSNKEHGDHYALKDKKDFKGDGFVCKTCDVYRVCSTCHIKQDVDQFQKGSSGDCFLMCLRCRTKKQDISKKLRALPFELQYVVCEKCGGTYHKLNEGKSRHEKRWTCIKTTYEVVPNKKEFYKYIVANEHNPNLLKDYRKSIPDAKNYLKLIDRAS